MPLGPLHQRHQEAARCLQASAQPRGHPAGTKPGSPQTHLSGDRRGLGMAGRPPLPQHLLRSRSTCQARRQSRARLSTSDPDTRRRTEKSTGQLVTDVTGEANQQSICRYPKEWVCWSAGHNEQMAFRQAGRQGQGGRAGPWAAVRWQESAAGGGRKTGTLDARMRLCCQPGRLVFSVSKPQKVHKPVNTQGATGGDMEGPASRR